MPDEALPGALDEAVPGPGPGHTPEPVAAPAPQPVGPVGHVDNPFGALAQLAQAAAGGLVRVPGVEPVLGLPTGRAARDDVLPDLGPLPHGECRIPGSGAPARAGAPEPVASSARCAGSPCGRSAGGRWARERGERGGHQQRSAVRAGVPAPGSGAGPAAGPDHHRTGGAQAVRGPALNLRSPVALTERELLKLALQRPELVAPAFDAYGEDEFTAAPYVAVRRAIEEAGGVTGAPADYLTRVRDAAPDDTVRAMITELAVEAIRHKNVDEVYAGIQLVQVRLRAVERRIQEVQGSLIRLGSRPDPEHLAAVQNELWVLEQYARSLKDRGASAL